MLKAVCPCTFDPQIAQHHAVSKLVTRFDQSKYCHTRTLSNKSRISISLYINMAVFLVIALVILLVIIALGIATLVIITKHGDVDVLKRLPGYKPHLLYGNALEMAREPDSE